MLSTLRGCLLLCLLLVGSACTGSQDRPSPPSDPALAPSTAELTARLLSCERYAAGQTCEVEVAEVHGYGAGTRPLARKDRIVVRFADALHEDAAGLLVPEITLRFTARTTMPAGSATPVWIATQLD